MMATAFVEASKHVLVEKPAGCNLAEVSAVTKAAETADQDRKDRL
jgi:predicted dehydrogenase